jgi:uncharacterized protein YodC (DUF2158 family)
MHTDRIPVSPPYAADFSASDCLAQSARAPAALAIGDIVMLNSGGPLMTVIRIWEDPVTIDCMYFDRVGEQRQMVRLDPKTVLPLASHR